VEAPFQVAHQILDCCDLFGGRGSFTTVCHPCLDLGELLLMAMARSREAISICTEVVLIADSARSEHHTAAGCYDTRAD
jgi:hypothetical protein